MKVPAQNGVPRTRCSAPPLLQRRRTRFPVPPSETLLSAFHQHRASLQDSGALRGNTIRGNRAGNSERKMALWKGLWEGLWKTSENLWNLWKPLKTSENLWKPLKTSETLALRDPLRDPFSETLSEADFPLKPSQACCPYSCCPLKLSPTSACLLMATRIVTIEFFLCRCLVILSVTLQRKSRPKKKLINIKKHPENPPVRAPPLKFFMWGSSAGK